MDRRNFFKTIIGTPLFFPFLLASKAAGNDIDLYIISDDPQLFTPLILNELENFSLPSSGNFTFLDSHPHEKEFKRVLFHRGWRYVQEPSHADLTLSFSQLRRKAFPSFTLVRDGRIWDIRTWKLNSLWKEMNQNHKPSSWFTTASFRRRQSGLFSGEFVSIYKDGHKIEKISLKENITESFRTKGGKITIKVKDAKAWVLDSSCRHKICIYSPPVSLAGERIICAPNHFLLEIQSAHSVDTAIG
jgi:hypothetical protein